MNDLKDQIQQRIQKERERSDIPGQSAPKRADAASSRLAEIRRRLDELSHATDNYSVTVGYATGPYNSDIAVIELYRGDGVWAAAWHVAPAVGGSAENWEVTYNPHGVETLHRWFRDTETLFDYLTASIAERVVEMESKA